jgi:hypothetical protein
VFAVKKSSQFLERSTNVPPSSLRKQPSRKDQHTIPSPSNSTKHTITKTRSTKGSPKPSFPPLKETKEQTKKRAHHETHTDTAPRSHHWSSRRRNHSTLQRNATRRTLLKSGPNTNIPCTNRTPPQPAEEEKESWEAEEPEMSSNAMQCNSSHHHRNARQWNATQCNSRSKKRFLQQWSDARSLCSLSREYSDDTNVIPVRCWCNIRFIVGPGWTSQACLGSAYVYVVVSSAGWTWMYSWWMMLSLLSSLSLSHSYHLSILQISIEKYSPGLLVLQCEWSDKSWYLHDTEVLIL